MRIASLQPSITLTLAVRSKQSEGRRVILDCRATFANGDLAMSGEVEVIAPKARTY